MGYNTDFRYSFDITFKDESKKKEIITLVNGLAGTRRMKRDMSLADFPLELEPSAYGIEGEFYFPPIEGNNWLGQEKDSTVLNSNYPPLTQPGLWLQWIIVDNEDDSYTLEWDGSEKFYEYVAWLRYLLDYIFIPGEVVLNGEVEYRGEEWDDHGTITIKDNIITST